jgi:Domain of unknown function (DUF4276)
MVRIGISVEGPTEERFVKSVLVPYLAARSVYITPISMGGCVNLDRARSELKKISNNFDYVTTLYDFYGFQDKAEDESKESLENKLIQAVHDGVRPKLIPYIQMYEFEGILFSCPISMQRALNEEGVTNWAIKILEDFNNNPESINNSKQTAPSKRLENCTGYRKTTHGPNIANEIGIDKIREMCAGFNEWMVRIEMLAQ